MAETAAGNYLPVYQDWQQNTAAAFGGATSGYLGPGGQLSQISQNWQSPTTAGYNQNLMDAWQQPNVAGQWSPYIQAGYGLAGQYQGAQQGALNTLSPWQQSLQQANYTMGQASPYLQTAGNVYGSALNTLGQTPGVVNPYLQNIGGYQQGAADVTGQLGQTAQQIGGAQSTLAGSFGDINNARSLANQMPGAVSPYISGADQYQAGMTGAAQFDPNQQQQFMNPYIQNVVQEQARLSNQNLEENILPGINSTFTGAGQFGSTRNADFMNRAIRDQQYNLAGQQANTLMQAQNQAAQQYSDWANKGVQAQGQAGQMELQQAGAMQNLLGTAAGQNLATAGQQANVAGQQAQIGSQQASVQQSQLQSMLQNAGMSAQQAQLMAQLYPQLAQQQAGIGSQFGNLASQYQQYGLGQAQLGSQYGDIANLMNQIGQGDLTAAQTLSQLGAAGAGLSQQDFQNLLTTGQNFQDYQQQGYDRQYQDWLAQQQFPLTAMGALGQVFKQTQLDPGREVPAQEMSQTERIAALLTALGNTNITGNQDYLNQILGALGGGTTTP